MELLHQQYSIPSHTGVADIYVQSIIPADEPKGIIQIIHGMAEHTNRYLDIARYLAEAGFAVFMSDHAGHGKSVKTDDDLGYFGEKDGYKHIVEDARDVTVSAKKKIPGKKVILWGHSMGSFVTRSYIARFPNEADGAVICGTAGANPAAGIGTMIAELIGKVKGSHYRSAFINNLAFGSYNKKFTADGNTGFEWLSVNKPNIEAYVADNKCGYVFTTAAYCDLFRLLASVSSPEWYATVPKTMPLRLISGDCDPVGNFGKGVQEVYDKLTAAGAKVTLRFWKGKRHEIHNEDCRQEVCDDILDFAEKVIAG